MNSERKSNSEEGLQKKQKVENHNNETPFFGILKKQENQEELLKKEADTQNI